MKKFSAMNKLMSTRYSATAFNLGMLVLRAGATILMIAHGYEKLVKFGEFKKHFIDFMGLGPATSLGLVIFAEFFCSIFVLMGLFTRLFIIPLIVDMSVALAKAHHFDVFGDGEKATLFLVVFATILILGPGKASIDGATGH